MNALMTRYKKIVLSAMMLMGMSINGTEPAKCSPCQAAAAARQSARDAVAATLAAATAIAKRMELDTSDTRGRAPREELTCAECNACIPELDLVTLCTINQQLQALIDSEAICCATVNAKLDNQGREAGRCCRKIKHELEEIEDLVVSVIDTSADCCSVTEALLVSVIDQSATCCSVIETTLGDPGNSAIDIPSCAQRFSIVDIIDSTNVDVITWLKSIYLLLFQVYQCACEPCLG